MSNHSYAHQNNDDHKISLDKLLTGISGVQVATDQRSELVGRLCLDSRNISAGDTFIALQGIKVDGFQNDGRAYIPMAMKNGANYIIAEDENSDEFKLMFKEHLTNKFVWIKNLREQVSAIASNYYLEPSNELKIIGVTGTNGKTSCSYLIAKTLQNMQFECFLMGTLGVGSSDNLTIQNNTTADAIKIQETLSSAVEVGAQFASMEISSHGIHQFRAKAVKLNTAVFTNLTRDHLDYHGDMKNYGEAKRKLFLRKNLSNAVINVDDKLGRKFAKDSEITANKWLVSTKLPTSGTDLNRWIWAEDVVFSLEGIHAKIFTPWGSGKLDSPLIGEFNLSNLLLVVAALGGIFKDLPLILSALKKVKAPPGRMDTLGLKLTSNSDEKEPNPLVIVDYAHTPDALEKAILALREHCTGLITCVFGCGGDRDAGKRPLMARVAEKLANKVIVTSDNPRMESIEQINQDIFSGFSKPEKVQSYESRAQAIDMAIKNARCGDAVLIAGKGHEEYQIIGKEKLYFSDKDECLKSLKVDLND